MTTITTTNAPKLPTIKEVLVTAPEAFINMSIEELQTFVEVLKTSKAKKAKMHIDIISSVLKAKAKLASTPEEKETVKQVENSVKKIKKTHTKPKAGAKAEDAPKAEAKAEDAPKPKAEPKADKKPATKKPATKKSESAEEKRAKELEAQIKALQEQVKVLSANMFPDKFEGDKADLVATSFDTLADIQKALVEKPFELTMMINERIDNQVTQFLVLYINEEILVLVDRNREINSTLTLLTKDMDERTVSIEGKKCEYRFYIKQSK